MNRKKIRLDGNCIDCSYSTVMHIGYTFYACDYMERMRRRRPCPYGYGCKVKRTIKKKVNRSEGDEQGATVF